MQIYRVWHTSVFIACQSKAGCRNRISAALKRLSTLLFWSTPTCWLTDIKMSYQMVDCSVNCWRCISGTPLFFFYSKQTMMTEYTSVSLCTVRNKPGDHFNIWRTACLNIEGILPKWPYLPCVSMAGRALLAGYPRYQGDDQTSLNPDLMDSRLYEILW